MKSARASNGVAQAMKTYAKFLSLAKDVKASNDSPKLEMYEARLLDGLASLWIDGSQVTVLQAMQIDAGVSPTTVHRKLKNLRRSGLIVLQESESDNRIKFVVPTPAAERYLASLGRCVQEAAR